MKTFLRRDVEDTRLGSLSVLIGFQDLDLDSMKILFTKENCKGKIVLSEVLKKKSANINAEVIYESPFIPTDRIPEFIYKIN